MVLVTDVSKSVLWFLICIETAMGLEVHAQEKESDYVKAVNR